MSDDVKRIYLTCDCGGQTAMFSRYEIGGQPEYFLEIMDSYFVSPHNTMAGRIRRALKTLLGKPVYYAEVSIQKSEDMLEFLNTARAIVQADCSVPADNKEYVFGQKE